MCCIYKKKEAYQKKNVASSSSLCFFSFALACLSVQVQKCLYASVCVCLRAFKCVVVHVHIIHTFYTRICLIAGWELFGSVYS